MTDPDLVDPFRAPRQTLGLLPTEFDGETVPMILRYREVRQAAKDWRIFSSDAPFRVPIPSEEGVRKVRQLPIESDPPVHTAFRSLLEPIFQRPRTPDYLERLDRVISDLIDQAAAAPQIEIVRDFALPLQSRALALLLGMPAESADLWTAWGTHVFHDGPDSRAKGDILDAYIRQALAAAAETPGEDVFSFLNAARVEDRLLSEDEKVGIANLVFAGGRDTIIHAVSRTIAYFAEHPADMEMIARDPARVNLAVEELVRVISPLTHIGRVCPAPTPLGNSLVGAGDRVSLCWASANRDEEMFEAPDEVRLDRSPNPHVGFGSGPHACLGATQARAILRSLVRQLGEKGCRFAVLDSVRQYEVTSTYRRWVGFKALTVQSCGS
jgi:cytochrome P450